MVLRTKKFPDTLTQVELVFLTGEALNFFPSIFVPLSLINSCDIQQKFTNSPADAAQQVYFLSETYNLLLLILGVISSSFHVQPEETYRKNLSFHRSVHSTI